MYNKKYLIIKQEELAPGHRLMCLDAPEIAYLAAPGQFLHVLCADGQDPLLRRPLSVHFADRERGRVYILYRVAGRGTAFLARRTAGDFADVMGPLGRGYTLPGCGERVAVVGGGIGAAPLFFLLGEIKKIYGGNTGGVSVFLGAATADALPWARWVRDMGFPLQIATGDGSAGFAGTVIDLLRERGDRQFDRVYACGPLPMVKELAAAVGPGPEVEVSIEERMGCGVGACLSCVCKVRAGEEDAFRYAHVCKDGPVFNLRELVL
ncbi:MAG: dihydroorotate dehydrogenase electron transfer subunit [Bacillota bacterium]